MKRSALFVLLAATVAGCATSSKRPTPSFEEPNVLWPLCSFDAKHDGCRVFPLFSWNLDKQRFWYLAGLGGYWRCEDYRVNHWTLPLYLKNRSGFFSPLFSRLDREGLTEDLYLCGLGGRAFTPEGYRCSWAFPFYYHDKEGFSTLLCGNTATSDWLMPFYFRNETDCHTLVWSVRENEKTGERGFFSLPLLSAAFWNTNTCARSWYALLGLAGSKTNTSGTHRKHWAVPFYHWDEGRSFMSLAYGWDGGGSDKTNTWWAAKLVGSRSGAVKGSWAVPFYSVRDDARFDEYAEKMEATQLTDVLTEPELEGGFASSRRKTFLLLSDCDESVVGRPYSSPSKSYSMTHSRKAGTFLLWGEETDHRIDFDLASGERRRESEKTVTGSLLFLYYGRRTRDLVTQRSTASHRVLWKLWDWERVDDDVSLDVFPFFAYETKASGYSSTSFCWRLFRNEYDPKTDRRSVDFLFVPVWR